MKKFYLLLAVILCFSLPSYAVNCEKKPCHKKCIDFQPDSVKLRCYCQNRKNVYYQRIPQYEEACDGSFEDYRIRYCQAKQAYDTHMLNWTATNGGTTIYLPEYDPNCYSSFEQFLQLRQQLLEQQKIQIQSRGQYIQHDVHFY